MAFLPIATTWFVHLSIKALTTRNCRCRYLYIGDANVYACRACCRRNYECWRDNRQGGEFIWYFAEANGLNLKEARREFQRYTRGLHKARKPKWVRKRDRREHGYNPLRRLNGIPVMVDPEQVHVVPPAPAPAIIDASVTESTWPRKYGQGPETEAQRMERVNEMRRRNSMIKLRR